MGIETALLAASVAASVAGTGMGIMSAQAQGANAAAMAGYQSQVARNAANVADANAKQAEADALRAEVDAGRVSEAGQRAVVQQDQNARQVMGQQEAEQAASGLTGRSQASARDTLRRLAGQDRENIRASADADLAQANQRVIDLRTESVDYENRAIGARNDAAASAATGEFARSQASAESVAIGLGGVSSLIGTATSPLAQNWFAKRGTSGRAPTDRNGFGPGGR